MKNIILTGDRPTGRLHLGHYVGSLRRRVELQNSGEFDEIFIMIADSQALTDNADNPEKVRRNILEVALDYLSVGLDPEKTTMFIQSQVPALFEFTAYYMNLVTVSRLQRNPTIKEEIKQRGFETSIPVGFLNYPVSQAADITAFDATCVPVGEDQMPLIEQTKEIVHSFNRIYGDVLVDPKIMLAENEVCQRLPGTDGKAKMSKSIGNCIYLADTSEDVRKKVMSMYTDPNHLKVEDPGTVEGNTVFTYLDCFCKDEYFEKYLPDYKNLDELKEHYRRGGLGDVKIKKFLFNVLEETLNPIRERRAVLQADIAAVMKVLEDGCVKANEKANATLKRAKDAMKINYFDDKDVFIFNDTKVFPARLYGNKEKTGARIEVFLLRELNEELRLWDVLVDPARKIRIGNKLYFGDDDSMVAEVIDNTTSRGRTLRFLYDGPHDEFKKALYALGETPLPHSIINRPVEEEDAVRFQSIFAKNEGAVTAPTASLHFSRELMKRMEIKGIDFAYITLHAGLGNFRDIDVEDLTKHKMDSEQMFVTGEAVKTVNRAKDLGRNVCAVGTTVMRAIESTVSTDGHLKEYEGWTNKFIFPPYEFTVANAMISNFHMPLSTLLMIVAAFGGYDQVMDAYHVAMKEGYRFGTYGDAMLIID